MNTLSNNTKINKKSQIPFMTKHFAERYFERILSKPAPKNFDKSVYSSIRNDMKDRMLKKEKMLLELLCKSTEAKIPIAKLNRVVVKNNTLITVY